MGIIGRISLKAINVYKRKSSFQSTHEYALKLERLQLENYHGLYKVEKDFSFSEVRAEKNKKTYLLFLHGTLSSTRASFGKLTNYEEWNNILNIYQENMLAFQYESLTRSPLQNALELIRQLPNNIFLHVVSLSGGGLIGDVLSRFFNTNTSRRGFSNEEISYLNKLNRKTDVEIIAQIYKEIGNKDIHIERFVRVASPSGGTTLIKEDTAYLLNVIFNLIDSGIGAGSNDAMIVFKYLISATVGISGEYIELPGLEVFHPGSPFIKILNNPSSSIIIEDPLAIISANCKMPTNRNALFVIANKLFSGNQHDLVVNRDSTYLGSKRSGKVQYFFDDTVDVNHLNYWENKCIRTALIDALKTPVNDSIPGFKILNPVSLVEKSSIGINPNEETVGNIVTGNRPLVVVIPGLMGSVLSEKDKPLWINYFRILRGELTLLDIESKNLTATSLIETSYKKLVDFLSTDFDVVTFPFDWRMSLSESTDRFNSKIMELLKQNQPIKIVGHAMGGVLVRDFMIRHQETWNLLNQSFQFQLVLLGAPLGGSYQIPAILFGQDPIIDKLSSIDIFHDRKELVHVFAKMPGLLCLLPYANGYGSDFSNPSTWERIAETQEGWPIPRKKDLDEFRSYRDAIQKGVENIDYGNTVYIAGKHEATPCGYHIQETPSGKKLEFLYTGEGDQVATWGSSIPQKLLKSNSVYFVNVSNGELVNEPSIFKGIYEILSDGKTNLFTQSRPAEPGSQKTFKRISEESFDISPVGIERTILGLDTLTKPTTEDPSIIRVSVCNGDLRYASYHVLAGHFNDDGILNAEKTIDDYLDGALSQKNKFGIYPGEIGTSEVFNTTKKKFPGAVIVGLGVQGTLTAYSLSNSIEQSALRILIDLNNKNSDNNFWKDSGYIGISSLVIGCGYGGLSVESSVRAIIQGISTANSKIKREYKKGALLFQHIEFIEQFEDIALNCFHFLNKVLKDQAPALNSHLEDQGMIKLSGSRRRLRNGSDRNWWKRISVRFLEKKADDNPISCMEFSSIYGTEKAIHFNNVSPVIFKLLDDLSTKNSWSPELAKALFELWLPNGVQEHLKTESNINWKLDKDTASFPWELLQDTTSKTLPLCVNAGMIRQLAAGDFNIHQVIENTALVIGDPDLKNPAMQLPGALKEGEKAYELLNGAGYETNKLLNASAAQIMVALFSKSYKIVHLAGHGVFNSDPEKPSGMLIGKNAFLTTFEIKQMSDVPEMVFVNCCYLGQMNAETEAYYQDRYKLAANIGTELIQIGVKAVIVAGWAVDDAAALDFMSRFYQSMLEGSNFGTAIKNARKLIYELYGFRSNTWGAYQCYGDPFYTLNISSKPWSEKYEYVISEEAEIDLANLLNQLDTGGYEADKVALDIQKISEAVDKAGIHNGKIIELEALLYSALNLYNEAIRRFEQLIKEENASYSFSAIEKYCNVRAKYYVHQVRKKEKQPVDITDLMKKVISDLEGMISFGSSVERLNILASTYKRYAFINTGKKKQKAYSDSALYYFQAYNNPANKNKFYSLTNWLTIENALILAGLRQWGETLKDYTLPADEHAAILLLKNELKENEGKAPDEINFCDLVAETNIKLCLLQLGDKKTKHEAVLGLYKSVWNYAGNQGNRIAELERLEFLEDMLGLGKGEKAKVLLGKIAALKTALTGMVG